MAPKRKSLAERTWSKVQKTPTHWLWTGALRPDGYGVIAVGPDAPSKHLRAHRVVYELVVGPIPEGMILEHRCKTPACVRPHPKHVQPDTQRNNIMLGAGPTSVNAAKTHCDEGHPLTVIASRGDRGCRICLNARLRKRRQAASKDDPS